MEARMHPARPAACGCVSGANRSLSRGVDLLLMLERAQDLDGLEQLLLALAVHPEGAGFNRAYLMLWNDASKCLEGWRWALESVPAPAFDRAVQSQRRDATRPEAAEVTAEWRRFSIAPAELEGAPAAAWSRAGTAHGPGVQSDVPWRGVELGAVVLCRGTAPYALLVGEWEGPDRIADRQAALDGLRQLALAGADALARASDARRRAQHGVAIAELARAGVSALNLAEVLRLALRLATHGTAARGGALWLAGPGNSVRLEVTHGAAGQREDLGRAFQPLAEAVIESGKPRLVERAADEPGLATGGAEAMSAAAIVPLVAYGRALGAIGLCDRTVLHPSEAAVFDRLDREYLAAIADLVALVVDQAARFDSLRVAERQQRELRARIGRQERLAALGEMSRRLAQEARNPLASISAFARRAHRELSDSEPHREYLEIVMREADRLEKLVGEQLDLASIESPRLKLESLNVLLQETLQQCGETLVRRRVRLLKKLAPDLPALLLDHERMRRVLHNILAHALEAVPVGGRIRVESRRVQQYAVLDVAHDGPRRPGDLLEELFVPFASARPGADGVGLGVAQQLVREHGGEIRLRSEGEWSTVLSLTLPVHENRDRRRTGGDRRDRRADRREHPALS